MKISLPFSCLVMSQIFKITTFISATAHRRNHSNTKKGKSTMAVNGKKLNEAIKGMKIKEWEKREFSNGRVVVYVRFAKASPDCVATITEV